MLSEKELNKLKLKFNFFKKQKQQDTKNNFLFGGNIFLNCFTKSASFINWFLINPIVILAIFLTYKAVSFSELHQAIEINKSYFSDIGFNIFLIIISFELIINSLKIFICPEDKIKILLKRVGLSIATTILTYKLIELSWVNIANAI